MPFWAAASAVTWAAKGVDLREPLNPALPADSHAITAPSRSVSVTIVLLKDVLMCAWPNGMFFRTRRRPPRGRRAPPLAWGIYLLTFFFWATWPRRGPLRLRALVLVRWPRTGRPRRWRSPR